MWPLSLRANSAVILLLNSKMIHSTKIQLIAAVVAIMVAENAVVAVVEQNFPTIRYWKFE